MAGHGPTRGRALQQLLRLLLDTRGLLAASPCVLSVASIWEVAIKHRLGTLDVPPVVFRDHSITAGAAQLPLLHHDPFDRLLIAQARVEGLMAVSSNGHWPGHDVSLHRA